LGDCKATKKHRPQAKTRDRMRQGRYPVDYKIGRKFNFWQLSAAAIRYAKMLFGKLAHYLLIAGSKVSRKQFRAWNRYGK
jgi:hypothetical protein